MFLSALRAVTRWGTINNLYYDFLLFIFSCCPSVILSSFSLSCSDFESVNLSHYCHISSYNLYFHSGINTFHVRCGCWPWFVCMDRMR